MGKRDCSEIYVFILAGGQGKRFWPHSTSERPKQFLSFFGDKSLLGATVERFIGWIPSNNIFVVTNEQYVQQTKNHAPQVPENNIIGEPVSRNTAPCVAVASQIAHQRDPSSLMILVPADHFIINTQGFQETLTLATNLCALRNELITIGVTPTRPATGYGYIEKGQPLGCGGYKVTQFIEKPSLELAKKYLDSGNYYWNSGMFVWPTKVIRQAFSQHSPSIFAGITRLTASYLSSEFTAQLKAVYPSLDHISVDHAIMERATNVSVIPAKFDWDDVGSWTALDRHLTKDERGNVVQACLATMIDTDDTIVVSDSIQVSAVGLKGMLIVEHEGNLFVAPKDRADEVRLVAEEGAPTSDERHAGVELWKYGGDVKGAPKIVDKPWGREIWWALDDKYVGKILEVQAGTSLSLQCHEAKTETMFFQTGKGVLHLNDEVICFEPGMVIHIEPGTVHRIVAEIDTVIFEVSTPEVDDVVRLEDDYGREASQEVASS